MLQSGFFDLKDRFAKLDQMGGPLKALNAVVSWSVSYRPEDHERLLARRRFKSRVHHRIWGDQPLTKRRQRENYARSRAPASSHVFGHQVKAMRETIVRGIGLTRIRTRLTLANLAYNMGRLAQLALPVCLTDGADGKKRSTSGRNEPVEDNIRLTAGRFG